MPDPVIICVAINGSAPQKSDNPAVAVAISKQVERAPMPPLRPMQASSMPMCIRTMAPDIRSGPVAALMEGAAATARG